MSDCGGNLALERLGGDLVCHIEVVKEEQYAIAEADGIIETIVLLCRELPGHDERLLHRSQHAVLGSHHARKTEEIHVLLQKEALGTHIMQTA
jgi:hypothetical protein